MPNDRPDFADTSVTTALVLANGLLAAGQHIDLSLAQWPSWSLSLLPFAGNNSCVQVDVYQSTSTGDATGNASTRQYSTCGTTLPGWWVIPTEGGWVRITNMEASSVLVSAYGRTPQADKIYAPQGDIVPRYLRAAGPYVAGTPFTFGNLDGFFDCSTTLAGLTNYTIFNGSTTIQNVQFLFRAGGASFQWSIATLAAGASAAGQIVLPISTISWRTVPTANAIAANVDLQLSGT